MKKIRFDLKEMFPPEDDLSIWIITLSRIYNDLAIVTGIMMELFSKDSYNESEIIYFYRLSSSHYREALKFLDLYNSKVGIKEFINKLDEELIDNYNSLILSAGNFEDSFLKVYAKPIRDNFFHYYDNTYTKRLIKILNRKEGYVSQINIKDDDFDVIDLVFADEISLYLSFNNLEVDHFNSKINEISTFIFRLTNFINGAVRQYLFDNIHITEVVE